MGEEKTKQIAMNHKCKEWHRGRKENEWHYFFFWFSSIIIHSTESLWNVNDQTDFIHVTHRIEKCIYIYCWIWQTENGKKDMWFGQWKIENKRTTTVQLILDEQASWCTWVDIWMCEWGGFQQFMMIFIIFFLCEFAQSDTQHTTGQHRIYFGSASYLPYL